MRDEKDCGLVFVCDAIHEVEHFLLRRHVKRSRWLVGDKKIRILRKRHRDHHALLLPAGEFARELAYCRARKTDRFEKRSDALLFCLASRSRRLSRRAKSLGNLLADAHHGIERLHRILEDVGDVRRAGDLSRDLCAIDKAANGERSQRLAAARLADERNAPVLWNGERYVAHRNGKLPLHAKCDAQMFHFKQHVISPFHCPARSTGRTPLPFRP